MALYEYNLFLVRKQTTGSLIAELGRSSNILVEDQDNALVLDRLNCYYQEAILDGIILVQLMFVDSQLEHTLKTRASDFLSWLWKIIEQHKIDYVFMGGGLSYTGYYSSKKITDSDVNGQLRELIDEGVIRYVHPLMFFSENLKGGKLCQIAQNAPFYRIISQPGIGCLLLLADGNINDNSIEILEPGIVYQQLEQYFAQMTQGSDY